jgi:hypothetical protein
VPRYIVQLDTISSRFPFIVVESASGKPALWKPNTKVGSVAQRFRSASVAQAAADKLNATHEKN